MLLLIILLLILLSPHPLTDVVTLEKHAAPMCTPQSNADSSIYSLVWKIWRTILRDKISSEKTKDQWCSRQRDSSCRCPSAIFLRPVPSHLCVFLHWIISLPFTLKRNSSARQSCFSMTHQTKHGRLNHPKKAQWQAWRLSWSRALAEFIFISVVLNGKHRWLVIRGVPAEPPCLRVTEEISTAQSLICWIFQVVQCRVFKLCTSTLHSG